ncbi:MAG TPA: hypothetical protein VGA34_07495 [Alteraurantiacibacter sp.]
MIFPTMRAAGAAMALLVAASGAAAQENNSEALLSEAGQLFEMGDRAGLAGDHHVEAVNYRKAIELVDRAAAMSDPPDPMVVNGRREMILSLGEAYARDRAHDNALTAYAGLAAEIGGPQQSVPQDRTERLHLARALRGAVDAGVNSGEVVAARKALPYLLDVGRAMYVEEPGNTYLTRRLAQDMQAEVVFRWVLKDWEGSAELARETLALFRDLAEANPQSAEALQSRFLWAYGAAELNEDDIELWREAVESGDQLVGRGQMKKDHEIFLRASKDRLNRLEQRSF